MIMKKFIPILLGVCVFMYAPNCNAQEQKEDTTKTKVIIKVKKKTILEQYEKDFVIPKDERLQLKKDRYKDYLLKKSILDTMKISDRRKKKLLRDLRFKPFSPQLSKAFADIKFEDEE